MGEKAKITSGVRKRPMKPAVRIVLAVLAASLLAGVFYAMFGATQWRGILAMWMALFTLMLWLPVIQQRLALRIPSQSFVHIVEEILYQPQRHIILMSPVSSWGHLGASMHLSGLLNQFGREAIVVDMDLANRLLSRKLQTEHSQGVFEHLLHADLKKPYQDPMSGAKVLPLESAMDPEKIVEWGQVMQRLPKLWDRWPNAVIILDIARWHEAYHLVLPYVTQVVFYLPPEQHKSLALPRIFKGKYHLPVSLVEIQPDV